MDASQILLVQIAVTGKRAVGVKNCIAVGIGLALEQPAEDLTGSGIFDARLGVGAKDQPSAVGFSRFPVVSDLLIPDKGAFVLAEEIAICLRHQFFFHVIDESVFTRETNVLAVGGDAVIAAALDTTRWQAPAVAERPVATAAFVGDAQRGCVTRYAGRHFETDAVMGCARVEAGLEGLAEPFDRARTFGQRNCARRDAVFIGGGGGEANENGCQQRGVEDGTVKRCGLNGSRSSRLKEAHYEIRNPKSEIQNSLSLVTSAATGSLGHGIHTCLAL